MDIQNGKTVAIGIEPIAHELRFFASPVAHDERPPYIGSATLVRLSERELKVENMTVDGLQREHLRLLCWWAQTQGYRRIYAERLPGHRLPRSTEREDDPLKGYFEIDIDQAMREAPRDC